MIEFNRNPGDWWLVLINKQYAGSLDKKEDGYYYWYPDASDDPDLHSGYIPAYILRAIADKLDELNKEWDDVVANQL